MINFLEVVKASPEAGEKVLAEIASREGDDAALAVLQDIPVQDLSAILHQADFSILSVSGLLLSPEMVVNVLEYTPATWGSMSEDEKKDEVIETLTFLLLGRSDQEWLKETLDAISFSEIALGLLTMVFWEKFKKLSPVAILSPDQSDFEFSKIEIFNEGMEVDVFLDGLIEKCSNSFSEIENAEGGGGFLFKEIRNNAPLLAQQIIEQVLVGMSLAEIIADIDEMAKARGFGQVVVNKKARLAFE